MPRIGDSPSVPRDITASAERNERQADAQRASLTDEGVDSVASPFREDSATQPDPPSLAPAQVYVKFSRRSMSEFLIPVHPPSVHDACASVLCVQALG